MNSWMLNTSWIQNTKLDIKLNELNIATFGLPYLTSTLTLITKYHNVLLQFTTARLITNYDTRRVITIYDSTVIWILDDGY